MPDESRPPQTSRELAEARAETMRRATEIAVRIGVLVVVVAWCLQIIAPFIGIVIWGVIIAIASTGFYEAIARGIGGRRKIAAGILVMLGLTVVIVPAVLLSETMVSGAQHFAADVADGALDIPPPPPHVADWPIIGDQVFETWSLASENLQALLKKFTPQLKVVSAWLLRAAGSIGFGVLELIASLILASVMLSRGADGAELASKLVSRFAGSDQGPEFVELARSTISSVVQGIVGVALIQFVLAGAGFIVAGVPAAGLWALIVLVAAVVQVPVALAVIPPIVLIFSSSSTTVTVFFVLWCIFISTIDNVLKPILFGRGSRVPTVVIFVGAIGGMLAMGIVGLFVGAVVLGVGFEIVKAWIATDGENSASLEASG
jgi:predicted PurR-regulated permease PerM